MVRRLHAIGFAILFVCLTALVGVTGDVARPQATATPTPEAATVDTQESIDVQESADGFARVTFTLTVYENGSVRWMETYARPLNESEVSTFETYATEFNTTETELYREFVAQTESLAAAGTQVTNRTMNATNFHKRAYVDRDEFTDGTQGKVEMSFLWTNLSRVSGDTVILGEAFEGGLYLGPNQRLVVRPGPTLAFDSFDPQPDSMAVPGSPVESEWISWSEEYEFAPQRPLITFQPRDVTTTTPPAQTTTDVVVTSPSPSPTSTPAPAETGGDSGGALFVVALIVLLLVVGTAVVYRTIGTTGSEGGGETATDESPNGGDAAGSGAVQSAGGDQASTVTEEDLLTDTDRVQSLLQDRGGRMRQSEIVEETDWSKSKVSMLLSDMEDDDEITKLRVGRENIVSLPGHEPDAAGSPFEDEE